MPELPEVETVVRGLSQAISGKRIKNLSVFRADLRIPFPPDLARRVAGAVIKRVKRRAKYIIIELDGDEVVIAHLGMSGKMLVHQARPKRGKHDHLMAEMDDGTYMVFNDPRRFGLVTLALKKGLTVHPLFSHLGPEPLESAFDRVYLQGVCKRRKAPIKAVLMDQEVVVGVGNIYASEALFMAGISPKAAASSINRVRLEKLVKSVKIVLEAAIESGGSTLRDYVRSSGDVGYFQHHFSVYGREDKPCFTCKTSIRRITQSGRSSFYCVKCQQ